MEPQSASPAQILELPYSGRPSREIFMHRHVVNLEKQTESELFWAMSISDRDADAPTFRATAKDFSKVWLHRALKAQLAMYHRRRD